MRHINSIDALLHHIQSTVTGKLTSNSRRVEQGDGFIAYSGTTGNDARQYVEDALRRGASICIVESTGSDAFNFSSDKVASFSNLQTVVGHVANAFYHQPSEKLRMIGVTGTNGKTSIACWLAQALGNLPLSKAQSCGVIGTLGAGSIRRGISSFSQHGTGFTTPDPVTLGNLLTGFVDQHLTACVMEVSSIGVEEYRLVGVKFDIAIFTNLTQDHLDYHETMGAYGEAKRKFLLTPGLKSAVINIDDAFGMSLANELLQQAAVDVWTVSCNPLTTSQMSPRIFAKNLTYSSQGLGFDVCEGEQSIPLQMLTFGSYNANNLLCVIAAIRASGASLAESVSACQMLTPAPGRMEILSGKPMVVIDFAHSPDALEKVLGTLRPIVDQKSTKLWCVIGCGGDRDPTKRPLMGTIAAQLADHLVITSDNPRSEDPLQIMEQIASGVPNDQRITAMEVDRKKAIYYATTHASDADVILIAGKGNEETQEIKGVKTPFSDRLIAKQAMLERMWIN